VRAAAKVVGVHEDSAYTWLRYAGLSMQRATPRKYSDELKAEFLRLVAERQIISTVARELGIHRPRRTRGRAKQGYPRARHARWSRARDEFLRLRPPMCSGLSGSVALIGRSSVRRLSG
jgi:transposase, IS30 family